jgi:hypothetical protein
VRSGNRVRHDRTSFGRTYTFRGKRVKAGIDGSAEIRILVGSMHRAYQLGLKQNLNPIQVDFARTSAC